jgi:hypothetical protein
MTKKHGASRATVLIAALALTVILPTLGRAEIFKARMLTGKAPVEPPMINVQIEVTSWTTLDEIRQLQEILGTAGIDAFLAAFNQSDKGVVRFMYARGWNLPIHAAVVVPTEKGKVVRLFFNRQNWNPGAFQPVGRHYFMAMELKLNEKGKGEGRFYEDAQLKLNSLAATIEIETYESAPKLFPQVQEFFKKTAEKK